MDPSSCRIAVTCDWESFIDRRGTSAARFFSPAGYVDALRWAGAAAVLLPHQPDVAAEDLLAGCSGLVLAGGDVDLPPDWYGEAPHPRLGRQVPARSHFERRLLTTALARDLPVLGICGGMQLLTVHSGGTLYQDASLRPDTASHEQPQDKALPHHSVVVTPDTHLARACGTEPLQVNSTHHQLVRSVGAGVRIAAVAPDGVVEAIELERARFAVGVQWHPEAMASVAWGLYRALVQAAVSWTAQGDNCRSA